MRATLRSIPLLALGLSVITGAAGAQQPARPRAQLAVRPALELGAWGAYDFDAGAPAAGAQVRLSVGPFLEIVPSGGYAFASDQTVWQANLDVAIRMGFRQTIYAGAGAALAHRAFEQDGDPVLPEDTRAGVNLFAGVSVPRFLPIRLRPYGEARWTFVSDFDATTILQVGVNVRF